jgi:ketosteroid isomerase-like protein
VPNWIALINGEGHVKNEEEQRNCPILRVAWSQDSGIYDMTEMNITAGNDVAFVTALMRCAGTEANENKTELEFRLTIGLCKIVGQWTVMHEHHSIPAN